MISPCLARLGEIKWQRHRLKQPSSPPDEPATFALLSDPHEVDCDDDGDGEDN